MDIHQTPMQGLLHASSPRRGGQEIGQQQASDMGGAYMSMDPFNSTWSAFNAHSSSSLESKVQVWGDLRLPPNGDLDNSTSISRFMNDDSSSRPLVEVNTRGLVNNGFLNHGHSPLTVASPWSYPQPSYRESADASSAVSSNYEYDRYSATETAPSTWIGSPDDRLQDVDFLDNRSPTSPGYIHGPTLEGHSHRSSMDDCLSGSSSGNNSPHMYLGSPGSYVNLRSLQLTPGEEEKGEDRDEDRLGGECKNRGSIPDILFYEPEHSPISYDGLYMSNPMGVECSSPSPCCSPQRSPRLSIMSVPKVSRRSRSGSGASQLSAKDRDGLMKPFKDTSFAVKARGAGKKNKEIKYCPDHPRKSFKHNSDFRKHMQTQHTRPFLCTFAFADCKQTFGSKNEWKRHVFSQHLQLHYWRCDYPDCAERKAYFNRKDLFGQHLKRMHGSKSQTQQQLKEWLCQDIPRIQDRCRKERRAPPKWSKCGYCEEEFSGEGSWDLRMEHVGKHYEKNNYKEINPKEWVMDEGLVQWALEVRIVEKTKCGKYTLTSFGKDSIEGEEKRRQIEQIGQAELMRIGRIDEDEDAEGEDDDHEYM